ncbi:MAG: RagB/SusD family nutrient uptake outer membrane protein [Saprospiraceae bacterium]|nr:RagB/SusD family nutrient uptake outer membrane protein [Saprospiraceae bacterium]
MKKFFKYIILFSALTVSSCDKLIEVTPRQSIDTSTALNSQENINAAITDVYVALKAVEIYGRDLICTAEALGDDSRIINRAGGRYVNQGSNVINNHIGGWSVYYAAINRANLVLRALPKSTFSDAKKAELEGEVKFLRALLYFNLMRTYAFEPKAIIASLDKGGVPLMVDGVDALSEVSYPERAPVADVYAQIYKDLTDAVAKAPTTGGPNKATKAAANALFARVALYNEDWANAVKYATDALAGGLGRFVASNEYVASWRAASHPESIFEVLFQTRQENIGVNESIQSAYTSIGSVSEATALAASRPATLPPASGWGAVVPTTALLALYDSIDVRKGLYQLGLNRSNTITTECTKFLGKSGIVYMDNVPVIRISELYLIRAEAYAKQDKLVEALADVNKIRTRAGIAASTAATSTALLTEIEKQRRLELAFEGHRWFDLKRNKKDVVKSTGNVPYGDARILAPLPTSEILVNKKLVQNAGY